MLNNKDFCAKIADIARIISTRMIHCPPQESHIRRIGVVETPIAGQHRHFRPPSWRQSPSLETVRVSVRSQTVAAASRHVISGMVEPSIRDCTPRALATGRVSRWERCTAGRRHPVEIQSVLPRHLLFGNALRCPSRLYRVGQSAAVILLI